MELSLKDRVILRNQLLILEKLYPDQASLLHVQRKALERGFTLHYAALADGLLREEVSEEDCLYVQNVLAMHRALRYSYSHLHDKAGISENDIRFRGFDGNNEINFYSYLCYYLEELDQYPEFYATDRNSHSNTVAMYSRMLDAWSESADKNILTVEEMKQIINARRHPDHR